MHMGQRGRDTSSGSPSARRGFVASGDALVVTSGYRQTAGGADLIRVITVEE